MTPLEATIEIVKATLANSADGKLLLINNRKDFLISIKEIYATLKELESKKDS